MNSHNTKKTPTGQQIVMFWKEPGETLAVMLQRFREEYNLSVEEKMTYAGRLDPMAEGIVPILAGDMRFQKDRLLGAAKTYEVDIVLGLSTDTADFLGLLLKRDFSAKKSLEEIEHAVRALLDITELSYPNYSSRPVEGKPLFMHARAGNTITVPIKKVVIHTMELIAVKEAALKDVLLSAIEIIKKVHGDFRQAEILEQWSKIVDTEAVIQIVTVHTTVSSGTYMRSLAEKLGELLGVPALAGKIIRTSVEEKK